MRKGAVVGNAQPNELPNNQEIIDSRKPKSSIPKSRVYNFVFQMISKMIYLLYNMKLFKASTA